MENKLLIKALVKCFGTTKTIKMLNQLNGRKINKKAKKYRASLKLST